MTGIDVAEQLSTAVAVLVSTAEGCRNVIDVLPLTTPAEETYAAEVLRAVESVIKDSEASRKKLVAPIKREAKAIDNAFKAPREELKGLSNKLRRRLQEVAQERERERTRLLREAQVAECPVVANATIARVEEAPVTPGVSMRWQWEVVSCERDKVPSEYLMVDMGALKQACKAADKNGQTPKISGVTFERKPHATVRR